MKCTSKEWPIKAPWGKITLRSSGDPQGVPVFLAHGRQDCAATFEPLLKKLPTKKFYYLAIDMPGSSTSDPLPIVVQNPLMKDQKEDGAQNAAEENPREQPSTSKQEPNMSKQQPSTSKQEPSTSKQEPSTSKQEPSTSKQEPSTSKQEPSTFKQEPSTSKQEPSTSKQEPSTSKQEPSTSKQQPSTAASDGPISCNDHGSRKCPFATKPPAITIPPEGSTTPDEEVWSPRFAKMTGEWPRPIPSPNQKPPPKGLPMDRNIDLVLQFYPQDPNMPMPLPEKIRTSEKLLPNVVQELIYTCAGAYSKPKEQRQDTKETKDTTSNQTPHETSPQTSDSDGMQQAFGNECPFSTTAVSKQCTHVPQGLIDWIHAYFVYKELQNQGRNTPSAFTQPNLNNYPVYYQPQTYAQPAGLYTTYDPPQVQPYNNPYGQYSAYYNPYDFQAQRQSHLTQAQSYPPQAQSYPLQQQSNMKNNHIKAAYIAAAYQASAQKSAHTSYMTASHPRATGLSKSNPGSSQSTAADTATTHTVAPPLPAEPQPSTSSQAQTQPLKKNKTKSQSKSSKTSTSQTQKSSNAQSANPNPQGEPDSQKDNSARPNTSESSSLFHENIRQDWTPFQFAPPRPLSNPVNNVGEHAAGGFGRAPSVPAFRGVSNGGNPRFLPVDRAVPCPLWWLEVAQDYWLDHVTSQSDPSPRGQN